MNFNEMKMGYAFAGAGGALYVLCTALFAIAPDAYAAAFGSAFHAVDVSVKAFSLGTAVAGFVATLIAAFVTGYAFAWAFNYFKPAK